ncbi:nucleotidyltransferase family protein [Paucibacter sp. JuS9]|uniref:nucleotidyltransferase domain-containing protein n=1 Tax=Roseateles TaxID=93681 RepID=UPI002FE57254
MRPIDAKAAIDRLVALLRDPGASHALDEAAWLEHVTVARRLNLIGTVGEALHSRGQRLPAAIARHFDGARLLSERQRQSVRWEVRCIDDCLAPLGVPVLLLKGSAYVMADHAVSRGRLFGDVDILVPSEALGDVESELMKAGWASAKSEPYDQRYYRQWMHELPPMFNVRRGSVIDVHHNLLPRTARLHPDPEKILARSHALAAHGCIRLPALEDLLIHSLVHLVHEGEFHNGLRDLIDIDGLIASAADSVDFWQRVSSAALGNELAAPVRLGLLLARDCVGTPVPEAVLRALDPASEAQLGRWHAAILPRAIRSHALRPPLRSGDAWAQTAAYWRAHALRMPPHLLAVHLARKTWLSFQPVKGEPPREE